MSKYFALAKINFKKATWIAYITGAFLAVSMIADIIVDTVLNNTGDSTVSIYSMLYIIALMAPIFIASVNYTKFINIGVKKMTYFYGCIINYVVIATVISLFGVLEHYIFDSFIGKYETVFGLIEVFGWDTSIIGAFFSQFAFLLLVEVTIHTLVFIQTKWYGLVADFLIVTVISVFTPIPVLRASEAFFFRMIIFKTPSIIHIAISFALSALIYITNLLYLKKR